MIQGSAEMGAQLSEDEVQRALDFCVHLFSPTTPEQHDAVRARLRDAFAEDDEDGCSPAGADDDGDGAQRADVSRLLDVRAPIVDPGALARLLRSKLSLFRRSSSTSVASVSSVCTSASSASSALSSPVSDVFAPSSWGSAASTPSAASDTEDGAEGEGEGGDEEVRRVLEKVNARRVIHAEHGEGMNSLEQEPVGGLVMRLVRGQLGLVPVGASGV